MPDRYTKAIKQLGSDKLDVRLGGIYALERVAHDSARDHPTVVEVLTAFIREHSHEQQQPDPGSPEPERSTQPDVKGALTVVQRRNVVRPGHSPAKAEHPRAGHRQCQRQTRCLASARLCVA